MEINRANPARLSPTATTTYRGSATLSPLITVSATANTQLQRWQTGQQVELLVLQVTDNLAKLKIDGIEANLQGTLASSLKAGQIIHARVDQTLPNLKVTIQLPGSTAITALNAEIRQRLPIQQNIDNLLGKLDSALNDLNAVDKAATLRPSQTQAVISPLNQIKSAIYNAISPKDLATTNIKAAMDNAAAFSHHLLKQHVLQQQPFPENNLHIQLLRLASFLRQSLGTFNITPTSIIPGSLASAKTLPPMTSDPLSTAVTYDAKGKLPPQSAVAAQTHDASRPAYLPPQLRAMDELLSTTEGTLAKIQSHQLHMLRSEEHNQQVWFFDLPVKQEKNTNIFEFIIYREPDDNNNEYKMPWQVQIRFDLEGMGEILAQLCLRPNHEVNINFITESDKTAKLFTEHMETLAARLSNSGINPGRLDCSCDNPKHHAYNPVLQQSVIEDII